MDRIKLFSITFTLRKLNSRILFAVLNIFWHKASKIKNTALKQYFISKATLIFF